MNEQDNLQTVRTIYAAFGRGDLLELLSMLSETVEWRAGGESGALPYAGVRRGLAEVAEFFRILNDTVKFEELRSDEFVSQRDKVIAIGHDRRRIKGATQTIENDWVIVWTLGRDGKVIKFHAHDDTATIAAGFAAMNAGHSSARVK